MTPTTADDSSLTLRELLAEARDLLQRAGVDSPRLSARVLTAHVLGLDAAGIVLRLEDGVAPANEARIRVLLARRAKGEPTAYLTGMREFYGLDFRVTPDVLIPRPETEMLVDAALERFGEKNPIRFADLGTGSGILAVTVAALRPAARGLAMDLHPQALAVARSNATTHGVAKRLAMVRADFGFLPVATGSLDLVLANPPYVSSAEYADLGHEVRAHEPASALVPGAPAAPEAGAAIRDASSNGLEDIRRILHAAHAALKPGGLLCVEFGAEQGPAVADLCRQGGWAEVAVHKDLAGLDRMLHAVR